MSTLSLPQRPISRSVPNLRGIATVLGATIAMATGFGSLVLPSVMAGPLAAEFGWTLGEISLGYAIAAFGMAAGGLLWGRLTDRVELRVLLAFGCVFSVLPLWALAHATALWQFHAAHAALGFLGFGCLYPVAVCGAGAWFGQRRGLVMGIVTAGGAVGQGILPYAATALLAAVDWRTTYLALAAFVAVAQIFVVTGIRRPALPKGQPSDARGPKLLHRPRVVLLAVAAFCCCACMGVPLIHLAGHVSAICGSPTSGATAMLVAMSAGAVGRIAFGMVADRAGNLSAYLCASVLQTACIALLPVMQSEVSLLALSTVFGFGFAGNMTCLLLCIRDEVPEGHYGAATGVVMFVAWLGMGVGGYSGGALMDMTGTYGAGFLLAVGFGLGNVVLLILLRRGRMDGPWMSRRFQWPLSLLPARIRLHPMRVETPEMAHRLEG